MAKRTKVELLPGTLDMLILRVLKNGKCHGYGIIRAIQIQSGQLLGVEEGSLYPALYRMERKGWIGSDWGVSEARRRAKFYKLTPAGRKRLNAETTRWNKMVEAISGVLAFDGGEF